MIALITAPTVEPVTLNEARLHVKLITDPASVVAHPDDAKVGGLISAAREYAELFCSRAFAAATYEARGEGFDVPLLPPVVSITSVKYLGTDGAEVTLANTVYELNATPDAPALRLKINQTWPSIYSRDDAVRVVFAAGPAPAAVPFLVKAAMLLLVGTLYDTRESVSDKQTFQAPLSVIDLLWPYRLGIGV